MEFAYRADAWQALYITVASAAAALIGLLFIALSLNLSTIIKVPEHRARARETLGGLLSLLILSFIVLIPGQDRYLLGTELTAGSLLLLSIGLTLQSRSIRSMAPGRRQRWAMRVITLNLGTVSGLVAGISLLIGQFGGFFWLVPTILIYILWSINNAWLLMVQVAEEKL